MCESQIEAARMLLDCDDPSVLLEHCLGDRAWMKNVRFGMRLSLQCLRVILQLINDNVTLWRRISDELNPVHY